jgi:dihydrofolate reductase
METINPALFATLLQQSPIIIVMVVIGYAMWSYIKEKNKVIREKDEQITTNQNKLMDLYGKAVDSQAKLTLAIEELRKDVERNSKRN